MIGAESRGRKSCDMLVLIVHAVVVVLVILIIIQYFKNKYE